MNKRWCWTMDPVVVPFVLYIRLQLGMFVRYSFPIWSHTDLPAPASKHRPLSDGQYDYIAISTIPIPIGSLQFNFKCRENCRKERQWNPSYLDNANLLSELDGRVEIFHEPVKRGFHYDECYLGANSILCKHVQVHSDILSGADLKTFFFSQLASA